MQQGGELLRQDRLNRCSPSELLLKWGINPSTLLKCTVTDSGKLLSAGLFACLLHSRQPNLPWGKALIKRSGVSSLVTVDTIMFYKEPNNVWRQIGKEVWGCNQVIGGCFPHGAANINNVCGFWKFHLRRPWLQLNYRHQPWHVVLPFWRLLTSGHHDTEH